MNTQSAQRIGYVLKMYPRFSETFIVNEILAHESAGTLVQIFSLRAPIDGRFHAAYAQVQAPVHYVPLEPMKHTEFWAALQHATSEFPSLWEILQATPYLTARDILQGLWLARFIRTERLDCLHAHFGSVATTVAWLAGALTGVPYVFTAHAKDIFHQEVIPDDLRHKVEHAAAVITVSDFNVDYLIRTIGSTPHKVTRIYNGLDLTRFAYLSPAERPAQIVAVGRLVEKKGFDDLVAACGLLRDAGRPIPCAIIGAGPLEDSLRCQVQELGLEEWVTLQGPQPQDEIIRAVQQAAVFAAPCVVGSDGNRDGLPTVLLEAMALGAPCVSTDVTGIPELVHHNRTGLIVSQRSPADLAAAIQLLVDDGALRVRLAQAARAMIEDQFDIHRNTVRIRDIYRGAQGIEFPVETALPQGVA